jgi:RimJ/RimL family protein N-acetyltransferase
MSVPRLVGERVTLRPIDKADRGPLRAILAEPGVARWWGTKPLDWQDEASDHPTPRVARRSSPTLTSRSHELRAADIRRPMITATSQ